MLSRRKPVKSVYGKSRVTKESELLWQEAITASPITKPTALPVPACHSARGHRNKSTPIVDSEDEDLSDSLTSPEKPGLTEREVLRARDPNTSPSRKSSPWKGPNRHTKYKKDNTKFENKNCCALSIAAATMNDDSLLEPPESPLVSPPLVPSPIVASTPINRTKVPWKARAISTQNVPDLSDISTDSPLRHDSISDISPISSHDSSELSSLFSSNDSLEELTRNFRTLEASGIDDSATAANSTVAKDEDLHDIHTLFALCGQSTPQDFTKYINEILTHSDVIKLGEASFSEVFLFTSRDTREQTVYKVIPFGEAVDEVPINDVVQEIRISITMSGIPGFVRTKGTTVVQGDYSSALLDRWDQWNAENASESTRPDWYKPDQRYCIIALENGGTDLEHYEINSWQNARLIFDEILKTLAGGENQREFEHRDLHWGNVLVAPSSGSGQPRITIIDYTLSRALVRDQLSDIAYYGFNDRAIFDADGDDYQFEIYRLMRDSLTNGSEDEADEDWTRFHPNTNVLWLHYLLDKLLREKGLRKPSMRTTKRNPVLDQSEIDAWKFLDSTWTLINPRRRYRDDEALIDSATKVLELLQVTT